MSQLSINSLVQQTVTRLSALTGEDIGDISGFSTNRLLQLQLVLLNALELGDGSDGPGTPGADGKSAYELAQDEGFVGTLEEWLESLVGPPGQDGEDGEDGQDGTGGGGPSDAFSPSNKPRLSAAGTVDYLPPLVSSGSTNYRFWGLRLDNLSAERTYDRIEVPLQAANVQGGETIAIVVLKKTSSLWTVVARHDETLSAGQSVVTLDEPPVFTAGASWAVMTGSLTNGGYGVHLDRFYESGSAPYPSPVGANSVGTDNYVNEPVGVTSPIGGDQPTERHRVIRLYGVSAPKGVAGKSDPADVSFAGTTSQRPTGAPLGMTYFDTTLGRPIWATANGWVDSSGNPV